MTVSVGARSVGARVRRAYEDMGVMEFAEVDAAGILDNDNRVAEEFDAKQFVQQQLHPSP